MDQANFTVSPFAANGHGTTGRTDQDDGTLSATVPNGTSYATANGTGNGTGYSGDGPAKCHEYINRLQEAGGTDGGVDLTGHAKELCVNKVGHTMFTPREGGTSSGRFRELFKRNRLKTITYCSVFWSFGMGIAFLGPTLLDLECRIESEFSSMSWVFFSQSLFTLLGTACGGFMVQRLGSHLVLLVAVMILCLTLSIVPECTALYALTGTLAVMGLFMGTIDTVANISMIQLYGRDVAPFLQALHFCYGLGAFLSPMVTKPFLLNEDCNNMVLNSTDTNRMLDIRGVNISAEATKQLHSAQTNSKIQYAFWIMSAMQVPVIILLSMLVYRDFFGQGKTSLDGVAVAPEAVEMQADGSTAAEGLTGARSIAPEIRDEEDRPAVTKRQIVLVTGCAAGLLFIYDGLQTAFGGYIYSYAVKSIDDMAQNEAAYLNACFWGTFAFGRLVSIGIATRITPPYMLLANITGCFVAMVMMLSLPSNHAMLYFGTAMFGTFMSSVFPTTISMTETYINVTSQITSVLVMTAAMGEMVLPVVIGHEFDAIGPKVLLVSGVVLTVTSFALYLALYIVADGITKISCLIEKGGPKTHLDRGRSQLRSRMSSTVVLQTRGRASVKQGGMAGKQASAEEERDSSKEEKESREDKPRSPGDKQESLATEHETVNEKAESFGSQRCDKEQEESTDELETSTGRRESPADECESPAEKEDSPANDEENRENKEDNPVRKGESYAQKEDTSVGKEENPLNIEENPANNLENLSNNEENLSNNEENLSNNEENLSSNEENSQRKDDNRGDDEDSRTLNTDSRQDNVDKQGGPEDLQKTLGKTLMLHGYENER